MAQRFTRLDSSGWIWIAAIWCVFALFDASQTIFTLHAGRQLSAWSPLFVTELASWLPWFLATPLIIRATRRSAPSGNAFLRAAATHLGAFLALTLLAAAWVAVLEMHLNPWERPTPPGPFLMLWHKTVLDDVVSYLIIYALIVMIALVIVSREAIARKTLEATRLDEQIVRAQLTALRRQMEPHFLFNTLNSITALVREQRNPDAVRMIVALSEFLRRDSEDAHRAQVTLAEEVDYLQRYLEIQKLRFAARLNATVDVSPDIHRALVPSLLLQPLVENAIKHGIARRAGGGMIRVSGKRAGNTLQLTVYNDGSSEVLNEPAMRSGIGIDNLRTRLNILHPNRSDLQLSSTETGGVEVIVSLPFVEA